MISKKYTVTIDLTLEEMTPDSVIGPAIIRALATAEFGLAGYAKVTGCIANGDAAFVQGPQPTGQGAPRRGR